MATTISHTMYDSTKSSILHVLVVHVYLSSMNSIIKSGGETVNQAVQPFDKTSITFNE